MTLTPATLPPWIVLDPLLDAWLQEDIGRGDRTTQGILGSDAPLGRARWIAKEAGIVAGLPVAARVFQRISPNSQFLALVSEGEACDRNKPLADLRGAFDALLTGERVALNLAMRLSGIATLTRKFVDAIADLPAQVVDTRKTTPGLRLLEKYAVQVGGAVNHRMGLDDGVMIKDNHIAAAGGIAEAIARVRQSIPYPLTVEVETATLKQVSDALTHNADIIMLDNMPLDLMRQAVEMIRKANTQIKIEASGNITLERIRAVAETGVDYISSSAPMTQSTWLDLSMTVVAP